MLNEHKILGLAKLGNFLGTFFDKLKEDYNDKEEKLCALMKRAEIENPWFTIDNQFYNFEQWSSVLKEKSIKNWISKYKPVESPKNIGLILAGNIPLVGFHDIVSVILIGHKPIIKLSSKDRLIIPFLLELWNEFSENNIGFSFVEKLENYDAVIATGSNNTARYLEYYFKEKPSIIRKNRTSLAVLKGDETNEDLQLLANDIFRYFGLGCRNVTRIFIPKDFPIDKLFENFIMYQDVINHHKYANNYDYNKAVYLLNQDLFWDNNFVMMREDEKLFSPLSVINFSRYQDLKEVKDFLSNHENDVQAIVAKKDLEINNSISFGESQNPSLDTYADNIDTLKFLETI